MTIIFYPKTCQVAVAASNQTFNVYRVPKGMRVRASSLMILTSAAGGSTATWSLGDTGSTIRFINALSAIGTVGALTDGLLSNYLYPALDTISVTYTAGGGAGATLSACRVILELEQVWPNYA